MEISICGINEHDLDLFLIEELAADHDLLVWLFEKCGLGTPDAENVSIKHSVSTNNGESDIEVRTTLEDGSAGALLIENKVDAIFQPRQPERYQERAEAYRSGEEPGKVATLLFAPASYLGGSGGTHGFDFALAYEEVKEWILERRGEKPRSRYKERLLEVAIDKSVNGRPFVVDESASSFWFQYWELVCALEPELNLNRPSEKSAGTTFIGFKPHGLMKGIQIIHKVDRGDLDLQFSGWGTRVAELAALTEEIREEGMLVDRAAKSAVIRVLVPPLDLNLPPEDQVEDMKLGIAAAGALLGWARKHEVRLREILAD